MPPTVGSGHRTINYSTGRDFAEGILVHDTQEYEKLQRSCDEEEVTAPKGKYEEVRWKYNCRKEKRHH